MGCTACARVTRLNLMTETQKRGLHVAKEWATFEVMPSSSDKRETQLSSLRNKITRHEKSIAHKQCVQISKNKCKKEVVKALDNLKVEADETTKRIFRTAYYIAKNNRPFSDHESLVELQTLNNAKLGLLLHGRNTATTIIDDIATEMRRRVVAHIMERKSKLSVLADESTTEGKKAVLIIYIRACINSDTPEFIQFDLVELQNRSADHVAAATVQCLKDGGFTEEYLQVHITLRLHSLILVKHPQNHFSVHRNIGRHS